MICPLLKYSQEKDRQHLRDMLEQRRGLVLAENDDGEVVRKTRAYLESVRQNGVRALLEYTRNFDCESFREDQIKVPEKAIEEAARDLDQQDLEYIYEAAANVRSFHQAQAQHSWFMTRPDGSILGQTVKAVSRAGLYVPGGRGGNTPLISSLLMTAIPAQVAGVPEIQVTTPPRADGSVSPYILATAHILGLKNVFACGGAWAVGALAYGAGPIKPVDVVAGPGNIWVTTAKRLLIGQVGIDMLAGPSEVSILADKTARADYIAADMLSQAEHDLLASAICISACPGLSAKVCRELEKQLKDLPRADLAEKALANWGAVVQVESLAQGLELVNEIAPEHLEIICASPWEALPRVQNAGAVFLGEHSAEPLGDYYAGPNHVLPTMSTARFSSALGVDTFCKKTSVIAASPSFAAASAAAVGRLARMENLEAHARSAELRAREHGADANSKVAEKAEGSHESSDQC
jgi:histidinol dehydrogenase